MAEASAAEKKPLVQTPPPAAGSKGEFNNFDAEMDGCCIVSSIPWIHFYGLALLVKRINEEMGKDGLEGIWTKVLAGAIFSIPCFCCIWCGAPAHAYFLTEHHRNYAIKTGHDDPGLCPTMILLLIPIVNGFVIGSELKIHDTIKWGSVGESVKAAETA
jgi:hypothetical protein